MIYRISVSLALLFVSAAGLFAQNAAIQGQVMDAGSTPPEAALNADVLLYRNGVFLRGALTDMDGNFRFDGLESGNYYIVGVYNAQRDTLEVAGLTGSEVRTVKLEIGGIVVETVVITGRPPLIAPGSTSTVQTITSETIRLAPTRDVGSLVQLAGGIYQADDGSGLNVRGGRGDATDFFIDGVRVIGDIGVPQIAYGQMEILTGGYPSWYGDFTSGVISITSTPATNRHLFGAEVLSSQFTDAYGYNLFALNATGPLLSRRDTISGIEVRRPIIQYLLAGEYQLEKDWDPGAFGVPTLRGNLLQELENNPMRLAPDGQTFINNANFIRAGDVENSKAKANNGLRAIRTFGRLDFNINDRTQVKVGLNYARTNTDIWDLRNQLFTPEANTNRDLTTIRSYVRFQQSFVPDGGRGLVKNIRYFIQGDYTRVFLEQSDTRFGGDVWKYGHVGRFTNARAELYQMVNPGDALYNPSVGQSYWQTAGFIDTSFAFDASTSSNPILANYNNAIYNHLRENPRDMRNLINTTAIPPFQFTNPVWTNGVVNANDLLSLGGVLNGFTTEGNNPTLNIYSLWAGMGTNQSFYLKQETDMFRLTGAASIVVGAQEKFQHNIQVGFEFDQRYSRQFFVNAPALWVIGRNQLNRHLASLDTAFANITYQNVGGTILAHASPLYDPAQQSTFDRNLRDRLGLAVNGTDFINIDALDPSQLSLDLFSADELINRGNNLVSYYGYDYKGNRAGATSFGSFFSDVANRPQDAFSPTYMSGYIHDRFQFDRIWISAGVRVDRWDNNQTVLRDPYVMVPTFTARETASLLGKELPSGVGEDWVAYVDREENPTTIMGFRDESRWFDATGAPTSPTRLHVNGEVIPHIKQDSISIDAFKDYAPVVNVLPRVSFSFPINDQAQFVAHYDILTQRPPAASVGVFSDFVYIENTATNAIPNPSLVPERTIDYELGYNQLLDAQGNVALRISAYYREFRDMIQIVRRQNAYPITYDTFENIDFATVKGFVLSLQTRRLGIVALNGAYTLQFAEGTGSSFSSSRAVLGGIEGFTVLRSLLPLSFDQRHTFTGNIDVRWGRDHKGPKIGNVYPLNDFGFNLLIGIGSGAPFTRNSIPNQADVQFGVNATTQVQGTPFGSRLPFNYRMDLRLDKNFTFKIGNGNNAGEEILQTNTREGRVLGLNVYASFLNLLDVRNVLGVYAFSGQPDNSGFLESAQGEVAIQAYGIDRQAFIDQFRMRERNPDNFSIPRRVRIGLILSF